jgi:hypothetical protein
MTDHAAAVEAVRARWQQRRDAWWKPSENATPTTDEAWQANDDCATLLRAHEAVDNQRAAAEMAGDEWCRRFDTLRAQHAALVAEKDRALALVRAPDSTNDGGPANLVEIVESLLSIQRQLLATLGGAEGV